MTDWREELVEVMVDAIAFACGYSLTAQRKQILDAHARAALAVAEPVLRRQRDDWREELVEVMARKISMSRYKFAGFDIAAREALAVAEPVIRERCAEAAAAIAKEHLTDTVARLVAAAIREGGKDE